MPDAVERLTEADLEEIEGLDLPSTRSVQALILGAERRLPGNGQLAGLVFADHHVATVLPENTDRSDDRFGQPCLVVLPGLGRDEQPEELAELLRIRTTEEDSVRARVPRHELFAKHVAEAVRKVAYGHGASRHLRHVRVKGFLGYRHAGSNQVVLTRENTAETYRGPLLALVDEVRRLREMVLEGATERLSLKP